MFTGVRHANTVENAHNGPVISLPAGELDAVISQDMSERIRNGGNQVAQELGRDHFALPFMRFDTGKPCCAINGRQQAEPALFGADFGDVDVEIPDRTFFELLFLRLAAFHIWRAADPVTLITAARGGARPMGDRGPQGIQAITQRQAGRLAKGRAHRFLLG